MAVYDSIFDQISSLNSGDKEIARRVVIVQYGRASVDPREFKKLIDKFSHDFRGHDQKDAMDFLCMFLDGLHEDLNRVVEKPYEQREIIVGTEPSQEQLEFRTNEAWEYHKSRNDSVIVDYFHGMFKSTTVCGRCDGVAVTFDPFLDVALPLPTEKLDIFMKRL